MDIWNLFPTYMLDMSWTYWYHHLGIQLWARKSWRSKNPSFILYLGLSKGDFVYGPVGWSFMRRIPGIRGRFIPHRECQESGVNVIFLIFSPRVIHVQEESELLVRNLIDLQCLQIICRIHLLMVSSVYHCARKSGGTIWKPLNSQ